MHMQYQEQLQAKEERVRQAIKNIAQLDTALVQPIQPAPHALHYRTKITLHRTGQNWGFYRKKSHSLLSVENCPIHEKEGNRLLAALQTLDLPPYIKEATLRTTSKGQQQLLILKGASCLKSLVEKWFHSLQQLAPHLQGLVYLCPPKKPIIAGASSLTEEVASTSFSYPYDAFFQIFPAAASNLFSFAINQMELDREDVVVDAHCGVGVISLLAAPKVQKCIGYEIVPSCIESARQNATSLQRNNTSFKVGSLSKVPKSCTALFLNPPRTGCQSSILEDVRASKICYISCNPETLSRDLRKLSSTHTVVSLHPFDLFPQTMHVETVVILKKS